MVAWTIEIEIRGSRIDGEGLVRLRGVFEREIPDFEANCELWSGVLAVHGTVKAETPDEAFASALETMSAAFDQAGVDPARKSEITSVTLRRTRAATTGDSQTLSYALLKRLRKRSHSGA